MTESRYGIASSFLMRKRQKRPVTGQPKTAAEDTRPFYWRKTIRQRAPQLLALQTPREGFERNFDPSRHGRQGHAGDCAMMGGLGSFVGQVNEANRGPPPP